MSIDNSRASNTMFGEQKIRPGDFVNRSSTAPQFGLSALENKNKSYLTLIIK